MQRIVSACLIGMAVLGVSGVARAQSYPTYSDLGPDLLAVEQNYPAIAKRYAIGTSVQGRTLWAIKISDNVNLEEDEPEFKYISTMHGDEIIGVAMCMNLIDYLTTNYGSIQRVTDLVDNVDIWIMPLMNPDGYDRTTRTRYNANGVDLNRNFPDVYSSPNNTTTGRQVETAAIMNWAFGETFTLSANLHGGELVVNYPFDSNASGTSGVYTASPDDDLFIYISLEYSQYNAPMYNSVDFPNGITNGTDWYVAYGGMQDWSYRYMGCNEVTIELGTTKEPPASQIPTFWAQNRDSMLAYMETCLIGVRGLVTDAATGLPIAATITVAGRDHDIFSDPDVGDYHRMLLPGTYSLTFSASGYDDVTVNNVVVSAGAATRLDVVMGDGPPTTQDVDVEIVGSDTITLAGSDPNGDPISFIVTTLPAHGTLSDPGAGTIGAAPYTLASGGSDVVYTVDVGYTGPDSFLFKATDYQTPPAGGESNVSTVGITVYPPAPVITTSSLPDGVLNVAYGPVQLAADDGQPPLTWELVTEATYVETDLGSNQFAEVGVAQGWQGDDYVWTYALPFSFPFYDVAYSSIRVWSNGFIDFGAFSGQTYSNSDAALMANRMIAPLWDDLKTNVTGRDIYIDDSTTGEVTVRWNAQTYSGAHPVSFSVTLVDDGTIRFHYGPDNATMTATVGISNGDGASYTLSAYNPATSLTNANSVEFSVPLNVPAGITVDSNGLISGTPTEAGTFQPRFRVTDGIGRTDEAVLSLTITASTATGDYDVDGDVDLGDYAAFQRCFGYSATGACGDAFEFDVNGAIDVGDLAGFEALLVGP